ncbi:VOC family protein [Rhodococcus sp. T2V]|uniref:2-oxoadipate dioxygenase/decarboxylase n=1 Tax=Rhodococcus sp. T2V TaxID=3034164 RepID=UPI0023E0D2EB|nr:VOC family protein [Rhodococcus sp. T2V]MDF3313156.1 VOC family protein [Rhodococcus sp. T2V]
MTTVTQGELRARFAQALSTMYGTEVPAYRTLVEVCEEINTEVLASRGAEAQRLGTIDRVTAERHGAIRVGTPRELAQVAQLFAGFGMYPVGFYDLRAAYPYPIPVVSTAFRPIDDDELAINPFRVFTSMLVSEDRRFFDDDLERRLREFLDHRTLFSGRLLELARQSAAGGGLDDEYADEFVRLAVQCFALGPEPVDRGWYEELERVSSVAADIGGVRSTHINHLTPRVLDIDQLYLRMQDRGIEMIDKIQGPPRWAGPEVLLRQTSFRALGEPRRFREAGGAVTGGHLKVRFGEVEARGIALTPQGLERYERLCRQIRSVADQPAEVQDALAATFWRELLPDTERELALQDLAYFTFRVRPGVGGHAPSDLADLLAGGWVDAEPIVYEDFLPLSAAGIFSSNLTGEGRVNASGDGVTRDKAWMEGVVGSRIHDPQDLYARARVHSLERVAEQLHLEQITNDTATERRPTPV